jgi:alcohol dehydrogenase class IV
MEINIAVLKEKKLENQLLKFNEIARILTQNKNSNAEDGVSWVQEMVKKLKIPSLSDFNLNSDLFPELIEKARNSSSMKGNPVELNNTQLFEILNKSM